MSAVPDPLPGLSAIADGYDAVILDLWGVIHDGLRPYPTVQSALAALKEAGKTICLLSNAPRRAASVAAKLAGMGIEPTAYDVLITSGEVTREALLYPPDSWHAGLGHRCFHLGPERDADIFDGTPQQRMAMPEQADFVVNTGIDRFDETVADHEPMLQRCAAAGLPMICANPDLVVTVGTDIAICAGMMAARYEEIGGEVRYHGKPFSSVYDRCLAQMGIEKPERVLAVGDSLRTDIAGAAKQGMDSVFVLGGIHAEELAMTPDGVPDRAGLTRLIRDSGFKPRYIVDTLRW